MVICDSLEVLKIALRKIVEIMFCSGVFFPPIAILLAAIFNAMFKFTRIAKRN